MIIFHAGYVEDQFWLWGETPVQTNNGSKSKRKKSAKTANKLSPYDAGFSLLSDALSQVDDALEISRRNGMPIFVWLSTHNDQPLASSPLIAEVPLDNTEFPLVPWQVTGVELKTENVIRLCCACVGKELLAPGILIGSDLAFWATVMRFAGSLVARQQYLPDLVKKNDFYFAVWKPVLSNEDRGVLNQLTPAMPAVCRAISLDEKQAPTIAPQTLIADFVENLVDFLIRKSHAEPSVLTDDKRKALAKKIEFDSLHDQWLYALRSPDRILRGEKSELSSLYQQVQEWRRAVAVSIDTPFRLCFRLEEPETEISIKEKNQLNDKNWYVRYWLQDRSDPSLLIPVKEVWRAKGQKAKILQRSGFNAGEYLLYSLGKASNICPHIESSLKKSNPSGYELDTVGAHNFLLEKAAILEQMGFGVLLPSWWTRRGTKQHLTFRAHVKSPQMAGGSGLSLNEIVHFEWQMALGDEEISLQELIELAKLKVPLVQVRGQWVQLNAEEIQKAVEFWKKQAKSETTARDAVQLALGRSETLPGFDFSGLTATGWIAELLDQLNGKAAFDEISPPQEFQGTLRPYQLRGYSWLSFLQQWGFGACLADDMGLGKTIQTLALIQRDWHVDSKKPVLLICPTSVVGNWQKEAARFTPELPVMVHHGITRKKGKSFSDEVQKYAIVISSYALLHRDFELFKPITWGGVILDEAQNIKNPETKQSKAARSLTAGYRLALTGTPVENNVGDLWSIMEFLNPGWLGTQHHFKEKFFIPIQAMRDETAAKQLKQLTGPFILRRLKTDKSIISDLPEKLEMKVFCNLTKEQASLYTAVVQEVGEALDISEGMQRKGMVLATLSKLKQVCNHPAQFLGDHSPIANRSGKVARLTEMVEEMITVNDKALIFTQFAEMGTLLQTYLQEQFGREVLFLHGGTTKKKRDEMVERFQTDTGPNLFILSLKAGGTGLNLTRANHVFHFDRWWNPAVENQATDRAFRIGQTKNVQVHKFLCVGTLEERIDEMIERKKEVADSIVGTGEAWLTELSTQKLKELFALGKEAVAE